MRYIIIVLMLLISSFAHAEVLNTKIKQVQINGNHRLDYKTIYFYSKINLQDNVTQSTIDQIIKNLHLTQLFSHIEVYVNKDNYLIINVKENPVINNIIFHGNKEFNKKDLHNDILKLKKLSVFTKSKLQQDISNLLLLYQSRGKLGAKIFHEVKELENNKVDIVIKINEGPTSRIKNIKFIGNKFFSDNVLKKAIQSTEYYPYKIFSNNTKFSSERLMLDQAGLYNFYTSKGFIDFRIKSAVPEIMDDHNVNLIFSIEEGIKYKFGDSNIIIDKQVNNHEQLKEEIQHLILSKSGDTFNREVINNSIEKITQYLSNNGNFFSDIKQDYHTRDNIVDVDYIIYTGNKVYINNINITNNQTTMDQVIRQKLNISEGDIYNASVINRSYKNILSLGFFESINVENHKINDSLVDLNFQVKERGTGSFDVAAGFSSVTGLVGKVNIQERNLFGTGKILSLHVEKSAASLSSSIDFVMPNFSDTDSAVGFGLFYSHQNKSSAQNPMSGPSKFIGSPDPTFSSSNAGFMLHTSHNITDDLGISFNYSYKHVNILNVKDSASDLIKEQAGKNIDSSVGYALQFRKFDNLSKITDGYLIKLRQNFSGLGGTLHYIKTEGSVNYSRALFPKLSNDILLSIKTSMGYVFSYKSDEQVKISQRFILGSNEIRGFHASGIGPRDKTTLDALGGKFYFNMINQVDFPIGLPEDLGIKGSLFIDAATLFGLDYTNKEYYGGKSLRVSAGFGISWRSPFGPMRLDFGFPLLKESYDVTDMIRFSMQ